jgi:type II secretory pathway predicted ATPase ExeA
MYETYFHLRARPFSATPDVNCFYASEPIQEALDELVLRAQSGHGIGILTGAAGTGKSLLGLKLIAELGATWTGVLLPNANLATRKALLQAVLFELGQPYQGLDEQELRLALVAWLRTNAKSARRTLLVLDEAHLVPDRMLEEVRGLADLSDDGKPLLEVVLSGDVSLEERLASPELTALNQRVACHVVLESLDQQQTLDYIAHRLARSGGDVMQMFAADALPLIARLCNGIPRCINHLCDHCLLLTYVNEAEQVTRSTVLDAIADLRQLPLPWNEPFLTSDGIESAAESDDRDIEPGGTGDFDESATAIEFRSRGFSDPMTSIEIGGPAADSSLQFFNQSSAEATLPTLASELGDGSQDDWSAASTDVEERSDCEDDELAPVDGSRDEGVQFAREVGRGIVPLWDEPAIRSNQPVAQDEGIAFDIACNAKPRIGPSSIVPLAPETHPASRGGSLREVASSQVTAPAAQQNEESERPQLRPQSETRPSLTSAFAEERIFDRYAAIDAGWPVPPQPPAVPQPPSDRGFSDPLDRWNGPSEWTPGIVPLAPETRPVERVRSTVEVTHEWREIARGDGTERNRDRDLSEQSAQEITGWSPVSDVIAFSDDADSDEGDTDYEDIEEQIGNEVLELCLETQQAIQNRFHESQIEAGWSAANTPDGSADDSSLGNESKAEPYDIIQPEPPAADGSFDRSSSRQTPERDPQAGLKRLFSTLRKRQK